MNSPLQNYLTCSALATLKWKFEALHSLLGPNGGVPQFQASDSLGGGRSSWLCRSHTGTPAVTCITDHSVRPRVFPRLVQIPEYRCEVDMMTVYVFENIF